MSANPQPKPVRFGVFELDLRNGELRKQGVKLRLQDQPLKVLQILLEQPGQIVPREELRARVWQANTFVEFDQGLYSAMARLRDALGDSSDSPRFIETIARRGYRFIAPVESVSPQEAAKAQASSVRPMQLRRFVASLVGGLLGGALLVAIFMAISRTGWQERLLGARTSTAITSLAVLPLENLSHDPEQEYFADGMTEALTTQLAKISSLRVVSRTSAMQYKGTHKPVSEIARELGVDAVVEGSVLRSGDRVRIAAQLVQAQNERHLWAEMYDRDLDDLLQLQGQVADAIANQIRVRVTPEEKARLVNSTSVDADLYELYLRGRFYWNKRDPQGLQKSKELFQQAIHKDPNFALAYVGLADTYIVMTDSFPIPPREAMAKARVASLKALEIDEGLAEAHASLAFVYFQLDWDWPAAEREFKRSIELNPGYATSRHWYSLYLTAMGRCEEAVAQFRKAEQLDPLSMIIRLDGAAVLYWCDELDPAIAEVKRVLEMAPTYQKAHVYLAGMYAHKGYYEQSMAAYRKGVELSGKKVEGPLTQFEAWLQAMGGREDEASRITGRLQKLARHTYLDPYVFAQAYAAMGNQDGGMRELEKAYQSRANMMVYIKVDPKLDGLRSDPRFAQLLKRMKLG